MLLLRHHEDILSLDSNAICDSHIPRCRIAEARQPPIVYLRHSAELHCIASSLPPLAFCRLSLFCLLAITHHLVVALQWDCSHMV